MSVLHFVVPAGWDDQHRPSGGNIYDQELAAELEQLAWGVRIQPVTGSWPRPTTDAVHALSTTLAALPDGEKVLLDGLVACAVPQVLEAHHQRLGLSVLVHLPLAAETGLDPDTARALDQAEREALGYARMAIATSRWTGEQLTDRHGMDDHRVHIAAPGVRLAPVGLGSQPWGNRHLLCAASLTPRKGHETLVRALAAVPRDLPWQLRIAGAAPDPAYREQLLALIAELGLGERISLLGPLDRAAMQDAYAWADLLVLASEQEAYGMCVTEALARGIPVYASATGGIGEALGFATFLESTSPERPGRLLPVGDVTAWTEALLEWMVRLPLRDRLRTLAEERQRTLPTWRAAALDVGAAVRGYHSRAWRTREPVAMHHR
ncbi:glycosyltransferase family 4 protein [Streptacidiphilus sp. MAP5-52]|uniref:glycosyltransferase family 4 protein n=1 Tax=Streptacidiphilus sp. MAP5-52 TaxID=3156267 RepID=UPI00351786C7